MSKNTIILLLITLPAIWLFSFVFIFLVFPDWTTSGLVGEIYGAANAFFSSLALIGIVFSIYLQRKDMQITVNSIADQLAEMAKGRALSSQPIPIFSIERFFIEKPRLYYTPSLKKHRMYSRYHLEYKVENKSNYVAADLNIKIRLIIKKNECDIVFKTIPDHVSVLTPLEKHPIDKNMLTSFSSDEKCYLIESIRSGELPVLEIHIAFRNIQGGYFSVCQYFNLNLEIDGGESEEKIKAWQSFIASFSIDCKKELVLLDEHKGKNNDIAWKKLFNEVKKEINNVTEDDKVDLKWHDIPGLFKVEILTEDQFKERVRNTI